MRGSLQSMQLHIYQSHELKALPEGGHEEDNQMLCCERYIGTVPTTPDLSKHLEVHIQHPPLFRILANTKKPEIIQNSVKAYSGIFRIIHVLAVYRLHIDNPVIFRTFPYSEFWHIYNPRHIQNPVYLGLFNNDSYNNINFLFFTLTLHTFQQNLKRHVF